MMRLVKTIGLPALVPVVLFVLLFGCGVDENGDGLAGNNEITDRELDPEESGIQEGYVIEISDSRILVVSEITGEEALQLTAENLLEESPGGDAVWYSVEDTAYYRVGQLLRVKSEFMMESYPAQSEAILVQIVEDP